jgi:molybdate transport system permease protein
MFSSMDWHAIWLSLQIALTATLLALPLGFGAAYYLTFKPGPLRGFWEVLLHLPLVLPPVVIGYVLLILLGQQGWGGKLTRFLGIEILFTWKAGVLASLIIGFPLLVRDMRLGMEAIDPRLLQLARTLGKKPWAVVLQVILPLSGRSLVAGAILMFARSLGEFGATIMLAGNIPGVTRTIPLAIYDYASTPGGESSALGLCLAAVVLAAGALFLQELLVRPAGRQVRP